MQERITNAQHELIAAIYEAAAEVQPSPRPLELLCEQTRSDKAYAARFNLEQRRGTIVSSFNVEPNFYETYREFRLADNPWLARSSYFQAEGLVWRGSDIIESARIAETDFYRLFLRPQFIAHTAQLVIRSEGPEVFHIVLSRRPEADDYEDAALETCRLFTHHARRALAVGNAAGMWRFIDKGFATAIDEMSVGVAVIEPPSTIRYMNRTFHIMCAGQSGPAAGAPWSAASAFSQGQPPVVRRLPRPLVEALSARPVPPSCIIQPSGGDGERPIFVDIRPYEYRSDLHAQQRTGYVIVCRSADPDIEVDEGALRAAFNLTAAEARVCAGLVSEENIVALAEKLEISPQTARTHLKRIFEKTYTTRQPELMKLLMSVSRRKTAAADLPKRPGSLESAIRRSRPAADAE